ncbi:MAG: LapA family protein [Candidatus Eisenbacteria bacterium]|uniref:LapA family protein n=1 Tax=Eiseniibacteriota bacterium TaxID=2212470 RepID=A0A7Y2H2W9_UNCEI|nr:LapA family protein [Candidatus Eisenbacteria bacterium]
MWFLKAFLGILVLAGLLFFASLNLNQRVSIYLMNPDVPTFESVPMTWALLVAFGLGILIWFFASMFQVISAKSEAAGLRRKNRQLNQELTNLRNMTVRDLDASNLLDDPTPELETPEP